MNDCPNCEYHKKRANRWRADAYRLAGVPLPKRDVEQKPVAWLYIEPSNPHLHVHYDNVDVSQFPHDEWFPVYKSPPQRTWVGLTDEQILQLWRNDHDRVSFARAIEAKLKEKNT